MPSGRPYLIPTAITVAKDLIQQGFRYGTETAAPYAKRIAGYAFGERALGYALQQKVFRSAGVYGGYRPYQREHIYRWQNRSERVQDWVRRREYKGYTRNRRYKNYQQRFKRYYRKHHRYYENRNYY